jgi:hypothetical protein
MNANATLDKGGMVKRGFGLQRAAVFSFTYPAYIDNLHRSTHGRSFCPPLRIPAWLTTSANALQVEAPAGVVIVDQVSLSEVETQNQNLPGENPYLLTIGMYNGYPTKIVTEVVLDTA